MRYPVTATGTREAFEKDWYVATPFGVKRVGDNYWHEGADINLNTGGDTDLNQELKSIAKGRIVYYHKNTHPTTGFGMHVAVRIEGPWGVRWAMYAHCSPTDFNPSVRDVNEGEIIARLGKSGTTVAHVHFSIWKVDPATVAGGLDNIANTLDECNQYWEDPIKFINTWINVNPNPTPTPPVMGTDQTLYDFGVGYGVMELQAAKGKLKDKDILIASKEGEILNLKSKVQNGLVQAEETVSALN